MKTTAVIPAAGRGERMGNEIPKPFLPLLDRPILAHTLDVFESCAIIDDIIVVISDDLIDRCKIDIIEKFNYAKVKKIIAGGPTRQDSVYSGLTATEDRLDFVVIHDGARPLVTRELIEKTVDVCKVHRAVIVAVPPKETIKRGEGDFVVSTLDRSRLWSVQTPQTFAYHLILKAHKKARENRFQGTDDASLVERIGEQVYILRGPYDNIKITTSEDLYLAGKLLELRRR